MKKLTEEHKRNISESLKGRKPLNNVSGWNKGMRMPESIYPNYGMRNRHFSEESKLKMSIARKGRRFPKLSNALRGRVAWNKGKKGIYKHSEESKQRLSESLKGHNTSKETKKKISMALKNFHKNNPHMREQQRIRRLYQVFPKKDTNIENALQMKLKEFGIAFRTHEAILGQPDIFIEPNICVFADGCWFHGCKQCYDQNKFNSMQRRVMMRDVLVDEKLIRDGYIVLRFFEHDIKKDLDGCILRIKNQFQTINFTEVAG